METSSNTQIKKKHKIRMLNIPKSMLDQHQNSEHSSILAPIKLNVRKFPVDFFGKNSRTNSNSKPHRKYANIQKNLTERKELKERQQIGGSENILPQAEITCFFKMAEATNSQPTLPQHNNSIQKIKKIKNQIRYEKYEDGATSIELASSEQLNCEEFFSCTFAQKDNFNQKGISTPMKERHMAPSEDQAMTQKKKYNKLQKYEERRMPNLSSHSRRKSASRKQKGNTCQINFSRNYTKKRMREDLFLPPIN